MIPVRIRGSINIIKKKKKNRSKYNTIHRALHFDLSNIIFTLIKLLYTSGEHYMSIEKHNFKLLFAGLSSRNNRAVFNKFRFFLELPIIFIPKLISASINQNTNLIWKIGNK